MPGTIDRHGRARRTHVTRSLAPVWALSLAVATLGACELGGPPTRTIDIPAVNGSGVSGTVEFAPVGRKTAVTIRVEPAGNLDMPAHIHPGTCDDMVPQPKFPLESVKDGSSSTVVPATIEELFAGGLALNTHKSNDEMKVSTACVNLV
jgi:hypothetical protein